MSTVSGRIEVQVPDRVGGAVTTGTDHRRVGGCITRGICEVTLRAADLGRLEAFYQRAFGCDVISRDDDRIWLSCGSHARLGIWSPGKKKFGDQGGRHVHFALSVGRSALVSLCRHLDDMGIAYEGLIEHPGGDRSVYVEDPEGNVVEAWDFFEHGDGARDGVQALTPGRDVGSNAVVAQRAARERPVSTAQGRRVGGDHAPTR